MFYFSVEIQKVIEFTLKTQTTHFLMVKCENPSLLYLFTNEMSIITISMHFTWEPAQYIKSEQLK